MSLVLPFVLELFHFPLFMLFVCATEFNLPPIHFIGTFTRFICQPPPRAEGLDNVSGRIRRRSIVLWVEIPDVVVTVNFPKGILARQVIEFDIRK